MRKVSAIAIAAAITATALAPTADASYQKRQPTPEQPTSATTQTTTQTATVTATATATATAQSSVNINAQSSLNVKDPDKCGKTIAAIAVPVAAIATTGIATNLHIPAIDQAMANLNAQLAGANDRIQRGLGIHNDETSEWARQINASLQQAGMAGADLGKIGGATLGLAGAIGAIAALVNNCAPATPTTTPTVTVTPTPDNPGGGSGCFGPKPGTKPGGCFGPLPGGGIIEDKPGSPGDGPGLFQPGDGSGEFKPGNGDTNPGGGCAHFGPNTDENNPGGGSMCPGLVTTAPQPSYGGGGS
mgnify:CR=1 FL=1